MDHLIAIDTLCDKVLYFLGFGVDPEYFYPVKSFDGEGIPEPILRGVIKHLVAQGLLEYSNGLTDEDGIPCGSGYRITTAGLLHIKSAREFMGKPIKESSVITLQNATSCFCCSSYMGVLGKAFHVRTSMVSTYICMTCARDLSLDCK